MDIALSNKLSQPLKRTDLKSDKVWLGIQNSVKDSNTINITLSIQATSGEFWKNQVNMGNASQKLVGLQKVIMIEPVHCLPLAFPGLNS